MVRSTSLIAGLLCFFTLLSSVANGQLPPPPPPGGGSTGGGYDPGGGGGGGSGTGNANDVIGGSAVRDNATGSAGSECSSCPSKVDLGSKQTGRGLLLVEDCRSLTVCLTEDEEGSCDSGGCCGSGNATNPSALPGGGGCGSCGGGGPDGGYAAMGQPSAYTQHKATRNWVPWNRSTQSSFGPGIFSNYDSKVYFFPDAVSGITAVVIDAEKKKAFNLVDGLDGDTGDGVFHDLRNNEYQSLTLKDANGIAVTSLTQAAQAELSHWGGFTEVFDVFDLSADPMVSEYVARLESATDRNGNTISISYRDSLAAGSGGFTAQELTDSPDRRWQIHQITDRLGDVFTYSYKSTQESGRWVVEKIDFPNNIDVDYSYADGHLSTVDHPNGDVSSYVYGQDTTAQTATVVVDSAGAGPTRTIHLTNDYMTLDANGQAEVINQPQGIIRMSVSAASETLAMLVPDSSQAGVFDLYHGTGSASNVVFGDSKRYYSDGWTPILVEEEQTIGITDDGTPEDEYASVDPTTTIEDFYRGTIPGETDETGREFTYDYDTDGFLTKKTFVADSTYEEYAYNSFKQLTRLRDRQGNVTAYEYDANGNMTKQKTGLKEVGGQDVAQPEYAELQWDYYPVGHANAGLLKTAFDAEWDGSSTDLHRTDYEYNARGLMTKKLESASVTGGDRPETNWTYDANDRVATTVDPGGHQSDDTYNDRGQLIEKEYDDTSTEQTLYGALGTPEEGLVIKTKDRRDVVTSYTYDSAGRTTQVTVGTAWDADILDGNADDTSITDRNEQSITTYVYLDGTELPIEVVRDGSKTEYVYDYRQRVIETKVYPYAGKIMSSKVVYVDNKKFSDEDYYGRKKYYGYRASDGQLIRYVTGAYPSFSLADQTAIFGLLRYNQPNPPFVIVDIVADLNGKATTVITPTAVINEVEKDSNGRIIRQTNAKGTAAERVTEFAYNDQGRCTEIRYPRFFDPTDTRGFGLCRIEKTYDGQGNKLTTKLAPGTPAELLETFGYHSSGQLMVKTDADGHSWHTEYGSCCGNTKLEIDPIGTAKLHRYTSTGKLAHFAVVGNYTATSGMDDPDDSKTLRETTVSYDALGRISYSCDWFVPQGIVNVHSPQIAGQNGVSESSGATTTWVRDQDLTDGVGLDSVLGVSLTSPIGQTITVSLNEAINELSGGVEGISFTGNSTGFAAVKVTPEGRVEFRVSDSMGRTAMRGTLKSSQAGNGDYNMPARWQIGSQDQLVEVNGKLLQESVQHDSNDSQDRNFHNGFGWLIESVSDETGNMKFKYDAVGNCVEQQNPDGGILLTTYDSLSRYVLTTFPDTSTESRVYDKHGNLRRYTDRAGEQTESIYDCASRRVSSIENGVITEQWAYNKTGSVTSMSDRLGNVTKIGYDNANRRVFTEFEGHDVNSTTGANGYCREEWSLNGLGEIVSHQKASGMISEFTYSMLGDVLKRRQLGSSGGLFDEDLFVYDRESRLVSATSGRYGNVVSYTYNQLGQIDSEAVTIDGAQYTVTASYDAAGEISGQVYPSGLQVDRTYDLMGELSTISIQGQSQQAAILTLERDARGREVGRVFGNGLTTTSQYDTQSQVTSKDTPGVVGLAYTYDSLGRTRSELRTGANSEYSWSGSSYLHSGRSTLNDYSTTGGVMCQMSYDALGNRVSRSEGGITTSLTLSGSYEIQSKAVSGSASTETFEYDNNGQLVSGNGKGFTWSPSGLVEGVSVLGGTESISREYDALGRCVKTSKSDGSWELAISFGQQVVERRSDSTVDCFVFGQYVDDPVCRCDSIGSPQSILYYHTDRQHSVIAITNQAGTVQQSYCYSPFGELSAFDGSGNVVSHDEIDGDLAYTGRPYVAMANAYDMRTRLYDPLNGRFISRDRVGQLSHANMYDASFAVSGLDPYGLSDITFPLKHGFDPNDHHVFPQGNGVPEDIDDICGDFDIDQWTIPIDSIGRGNVHNLLHYGCAKEKLGQNWNDYLQDLLDDDDGDCCNFLMDVSTALNEVWACAWGKYLGPGGVIPPIQTHPYGEPGPNNWTDFFDRMDEECTPEERECEKMREPVPNPYVNSIPSWVPEDPDDDWKQDVCIGIGAAVGTVVLAKVVIAGKVYLTIAVTNPHTGRVVVRRVTQEAVRQGRCRPYHLTP